MINTEEEQAEEVDQATMKVMKIVSTDLEKPSVIKGAIQSFISKDSKKMLGVIRIHDIISTSIFK